MLSEEENQAANSQTSSSRRPFRLPRSTSCSPTFGRFALKKNSSVLTEEELQAVVVKESCIRSENPEKYGFGGYMHLRFGNILGQNNQFQVLRKIGFGHFSTVWLCRHRQHNYAYYAVKVMKSANKYKETAQNEVNVLQYVKNQNSESIGYNRIVTFYSMFNETSVNGIHPCMVFEVMGPSLFELLKKSNFQGIYHPTAKKIMKQILEGMKFLHEVCHIIHTDLKPENILIVPSQSSFQETVAYFNRFVTLKIQMPKSYVSAPQWQNYVEVHGNPNDSSSTVTESSSSSSSAHISSSSSNLYMAQTKTTEPPKQSRSLLFANPNIQVKIADLGNACLENDRPSSWIQTKQYRALEVLIGAGYSFPVDIWSVGCIAFEICTGDFLFNPRDLPNLSYKEHHLGLIWETLNGIPKEISLSGRHSADYFDNAGNMKKINFRRRRPWRMEDVLVDKYDMKRKNALVLTDFIKSLVNPNPNLRATASSALHHRWIEEMGG